MNDGGRHVLLVHETSMTDQIAVSVQASTSDVEDYLDDDGMAEDFNFTPGQ